ncbi:MAG TPA: glycosyltransferase family 39 protein [Isosphaeraceae bacterium]
MREPRGTDRAPGVAEGGTGRAPARPIGLGDLGWPLAIGLLGLLLRLAYVVDFARHPLGRLVWGDEGAYWSRAQEILDGAWLPARPFYQDPLYPYLLAAAARLVGPKVARLRVALACLGALTPVLVYWAGRRGLGRAEGIVAGLIAAAYGPLIFTDGLVEKEGMAALGAAAALGLTAWATDPSGRAWRAIVPGLAWGLVALLRANALVLGPLGAAWWIFGSDIPGKGRRRVRACLFLLGFAAAIAPATAVNAVVARPSEFILTTWQGGANFYIGNGPEATGTYAAPPFVEANPAREADDFAAEASRRLGRPLRPSEVSRFWLAEGLARWRQAPLASIRLLAHKLGLLAHDFEIPDNQDMEVVRLVAAPRLAWGVLGFGVLLPFAALGLGCEERTPFWWFLVLSTAAGLATTALFFVVARYRIPWLPGLALLAAAGAVDLARRVAHGRWRSAAARVLLLAAPAALLAWRPMADPAPDRWGHAEIELAMAYLADGGLESAIDALDDARALGEGPANRVAELLDAGPVRDRLAALVADRSGTTPGLRPPSDLDHARWLRQLPETRGEAGRMLEAILRARPDDPSALREWGAWWLGEPGDPSARGRAGAALNRARDRAGVDPSASVLLALLEADPGHLEGRAGGMTDRSRGRVRLARAILAQRPRRRAPPDPPADGRGAR